MLRHRALLVPAFCFLVVFTTAIHAVPFRRGEVNGDGSLDVSDPVCLLSYLFVGEGPCSRPPCLDALDANDDGSIEISDPIVLLSFLFRGGPPPAPPFEECGDDPTLDGNDCASFPACASGDQRTLVVEADFTVESLWSEAYTTLEAVDEVRSEIRFRSGDIAFARDADSEGVSVVESFRIGEGDSLATPIDAGSVRFEGGAFFPYEFHRLFETSLGIADVVVAYRPDEDEREPLDCALVDGANGAERTRIRVDYSESSRTIHYSCFHADVWMGVSPFTLTLEDETELEITFGDAYFFRGVAGETANRYLARARVSFRGSDLDVRDRTALTYAAWHHNASQEYRVVFPEPIEGIAGVEVVECPPPVQFPTFCRLEVDEARAYLLDESLERVEELAIRSVTQ